MKNTTLYTAEQAVWGADEATVIYFYNRNDRDNYVKSHDYASKGATVRVSETTLANMLDWRVEIR